MFTKDILVSQPERSEPAEKKKEANACYARQEGFFDSYL